MFNSFSAFIFGCNKFYKAIKEFFLITISYIYCFVVVIIVTNILLGLAYSYCCQHFTTQILDKEALHVYYEAIRACSQKFDGSAKTKSLGGKHYIFLIVDYYSMFSWELFLGEN